MPESILIDLGTSAAATYTPGTTFRYVIPPSLLLATGERIRIHFRWLSQAYSVKMTIGLQSTSGDAWDIDPATFKKVTRGGSETISISAAGAISDYISLYVDGTRAIVISYYGVSGTIPRLYSTTAGVGVYRRLSGDYTSPADQSSFTAYSTPVHVWQSITIDNGVVVVANALEGVYGLYTDHIEQGLVGQYHLLAAVPPAALVGVYSMIMEQALIGRYGNAPQLASALVGRYGDAALVQTALVGRYGDMVPVLSALEGRYHLMHAVASAMVGQYAICGSEVLAALVGRYDLKERNEITAALVGYYSLLPGATVQQFVCPVRIGGVAVRWASVSWTLSEDAYLIEATITLRDSSEFGSINKLDTVEIDWAGTTHTLFVASKLRARSISGDAGSAEYGAEYTIVCRSLSAGLDAPHALPVTMSWPATTLASSIAADLIATLPDLLTLDWRLEDWLQPGGTFFLTDESPLEGLRKLAAIIGGIVQTSPENALILRMADAVPPASWATTTPAWTIDDSGLFSDAESEAESNRYNVVTVTNQGEANSSIRFEVNDISEYRKQVRGYRVPWADFGLATSGGAWITIEDGGIVEEQVVDELVEFIDGSASAAKPIYSQVAVVWQQAILGSVTASEDGSLTSAVLGNSMAKITYTTRYHLWIGASDRSEDVQFYEVSA